LDWSERWVCEVVVVAVSSSADKGGSGVRAEVEVFEEYSRWSLDGDDVDGVDADEEDVVDADEMSAGSDDTESVSPNDDGTLILLLPVP